MGETDHSAVREKGERPPFPMESRRLRIACVGEVMVELSLDGRGSIALLGFAGDTLNTAIFLTREMPGAHDVSFVTCLGTDTFSGR